MLVRAAQVLALGLVLVGGGVSLAGRAAAQPAPSPSATAPACVGADCIPQPNASATGPAAPGSGQAPGQQPATSDGCGFTNLGGCVTGAINGFFRAVVVSALNPLLDLLAHTLLTTPTLASLPRIGALWGNSWEILLACYGLLILIGGVVVMAHESLQTRYALKQILPRVVAGFLASGLSLFLAGKAIELANALSAAVMGDGLDAHTAAQTLRNMAIGSLTGADYIALLALFLAGMLVALLVGYAIRIILTVVLVAGAPLALMCHALPQTEAVASWWWRAFGGVLAVQVVQSLTLITAMRVFFAPGGFGLFGPNGNGLVNMIVALALTYILFKIPFWVLRSVRGRGGRRSLVGGMARAYVAGRALGLVSGGHRPAGGGARAGGTLAKAPAARPTNGPASGPASTTPLPRPARPRFLAPGLTATAPTTSRPSGPARPARFTSPGGAPPAGAVPSRATSVPATPRFRAPRPSHANPPPIRAASTPPRLRFQPLAPAAPRPAPPPRPPKPAPPPAFRPPTQRPHGGDRR
jgi:hypothetical protein